jgi:hypothetical protein
MFKLWFGIKVQSGSGQDRRIKCSINEIGLICNIVYRSDFKESIGYYSILENDSKSFDGNLGIANAYYADGETHKSLDAV